MNTTDKLAEALRLAREWVRHEEAGEGPQAYDVIKAADEAIAAHDAEQAAKAVPADLRSAAERTRQDLGPTGSNYPDVRVLLAFVEQALAAPTPQPAQAERVGLTDEQIAEGRYRTWAAEPEDAPEAWSFLRGARWAESALAVRWGVKLGATTQKAPSLCGGA